MALPSDLTTIVVTGTYTTATGAPAAGNVIFYLPEALADSTGKVILGPGQNTVTLNSSGYFSITLPCTDNADLNPAGFTYTVTEQIPGLGRSYSISLPHTLGSTVDISALAPVAAVPAPSAFAAANTWTATQTYSGNPGLKITTGAASGDVLTSDGSGNATWQAPTGGVQIGGDLGGTSASPQVISTHLSSPLPLAQGGTGQASAGAAFGALSPLTTLGDILYENATPAGARLAGNTSSTKNFLTQTGTGSASAAPAWGTIAAADLPAASTSTQGAVILDGTASDIQPAGVAAAGAKGQAADAKHVHPYQPWQFQPESFGAKGDGQIVGDISVSNANPQITSVGLSAPSAPSVSNSGTGGTILAGVYQVRITYVNRYGETVASASTSTTTSGSISTITVTAPAYSGNASGWNCYVTQPGGSTYTKQNSSPLMLAGASAGQNLVLIAPPTSGGAQPPGSNTTPSAPFSAGDVGKYVMINGALGSANLPLLTTILSYQSPTQVTLNANPSVTVSGLPMIWGTDDTAAIQAALNAAQAYAVVNDYYGEVVFGPKYYIVAGAAQQSTYPYYDTQLKIPYPPSNSVRKLVIGLRGAGRNDHLQFWGSTEPNLAGTVLVSMITATAGPDPNGGFPSVLGTPTGWAGFPGGSVQNWPNVKVAIQDICVACPAYTNLTAFDLTLAGGCYIDGCSAHIFAQPLYGGGVLLNNLYGDAAFTSKTGCGLRAPAVGNNEDNWITSFAAEGYNCAVNGSEALTIGRLATIYNDVPLQINNGSVASSGAAHGIVIERWTAEAYNGAIRMYGGVCQVDIRMTTETAGPAYDVSDASGGGLTGIVRWYDPVDSRAPIVSGATGLKVIDEKLGPGHMGSPPSVPGSGSSATPVYRDASVVVHTGSGVTVSAVTIDGTATGLTMAQNSSLALPVVASGKTVALTYAGGTPTWDWWLS